MRIGLASDGKTLMTKKSMSHGAPEHLVTAITAPTRTWNTSTPPMVTHLISTPLDLTPETTDSLSERLTPVDLLPGLKNLLLLALNAIALLQTLKKHPSHGPTSLLATLRIQAHLAISCSSRCQQVHFLLQQLLFKDHLDLNIHQLEVAHTPLRLHPHGIEDMIHQTHGALQPEFPHLNPLTTGLNNQTTTTMDLQFNPDPINLFIPALLTGDILTQFAIGTILIPIATTKLPLLYLLLPTMLMNSVIQEDHFLPVTIRAPLLITTNLDQLYVMPMIQTLHASNPPHLGMMCNSGIYPLLTMLLHIPLLVQVELNVIPTILPLSAITDPHHLHNLSLLPKLKTMDVVLTTLVHAGTQPPTLILMPEAGPQMDVPSQLPLRHLLVTLTDNSPVKSLLTGPHGDSPLLEMLLTKYKWLKVATVTGEPSLSTAAEPTSLEHACTPMDVTLE